MTPLDTRPEVLAFLQDAKEHPEQDAPRLALADWIDEHGDPARAEFVRLGCALAPGARPPLAGEDRDRALRRQQELLARFGGGWLGPLWPWGVGQAWHRGLLSALLGRHADRRHLADLLPWVDSVTAEVSGRRGLDEAVGLLNAGTFNHDAVDLRRPFGEGGLLACLGRVRESA